MTFNYLNAYNRDGDPITQDEWARLHSDHEYKRVAEDTVGEWWVSTVWLGIDHGYGDIPVIFETMVFPMSENASTADFSTDQHCERYTTEADAIRGHAETVTALRNGTLNQTPTDDHDTPQGILRNITMILNRLGGSTRS